MQIHSLILIVLLVVGSQARLNDLQQEVIYPDPPENPEFEQGPDEQGSDEQQQQFNDEQENYLAQFSKVMSDFKPKETFYFNLTTYEQQDFIFWPPPNTKQLRGVYYISEGIDEQEVAAHNTGLNFVGESGGKVIKTQQNRRLGVFQVPFEKGDMKLIFKSDLRDLTLYLSYEMLEKAKQPVIPKGIKQNSQGEWVNQKGEVVPSPTSQPEITPMGQIFERFKKVEIEITGQEQIIKELNHFSNHSINKIEDEFFWIKFRMIVETLLVVICGIVCLFLLHRKLSKGYELLV